MVDDKKDDDKKDDGKEFNHFEFVLDVVVVFGIEFLKLMLSQFTSTGEFVITSLTFSQVAIPVVLTLVKDQIKDALHVAFSKERSRKSSKRKRVCA